MPPLNTVLRKLLLMKKPSVYDFPDFATLFAAYVEWMKELNKHFSWRWLAKRLQLKSHTYAINIANGSKTPSEALLLKISNLFGFTLDEYVYVKFLIGFQTAKNDSERTFYRTKLAETRRTSPLPALKAEEFDTIAKWFYLVIFEMVGLEGFQPDAAWIASKLTHPIPVEVVSEALKRLISLGLLAPDGKGGLSRAVDGIFTTHNIPSEAIVLFHEQMLDLAKHALRSIPVKERVFLGYTMPFDSGRIEEAQNLMVEFRARFAQLMEGGKADSIYHLALNYFPTTKAKS